VSDLVTTARTARESLARGLGALQSDPNLPPRIVELAAPIAQAMGALHAIERSGGAALVPNAELALNHTRGALAQLQAEPSGHPAILAAMEAVASSLGLVHSLARADKPAAAVAPAPQPQLQPQQFQPQPAPFQPPFQPPQQPPFQPPQQPPFQPPQQPPFQPPQQPQFQPPFQPPQQPPFQPPQQQPFQGPSQSPFQPPQQAAYAPTMAAPGQGFPPPGAPAPGGAYSTSSLNPPAAPMPSGDVPIVSADLGTNSATNFYKGLSGNDVIDHGGVFVATYMVPKLGVLVRLKISLPGGYEFEANGVVRWVREQSDGGDVSPGFGAQLTQISPEARQLVYRYVRNREPLFHDDL
jgi:hypothetical protein